MNKVIDVDSHWSFPWDFRIFESPLKRFKDSLPDEAGMLAYFIVDDLMRHVSREERPDPKLLFPARVRANGQVTNTPVSLDANIKPSSVADRLAWMDRIGIDFCLVNSGAFPGVFPLIDNLTLRQEFCREANDLLADALDGATDRLSPVVYADLTDLDAAIAELTRMRARGARAFSIRAEPVNGMSLGHPHFDRLWSALTDLGMIASVHIGFAPAVFGDWGRLGLDLSTADGRGRFLRMGLSQLHQAAELCLAALLFGGVFERHPKLTVLIAELHVYWLPDFVARIDQMAPSNIMTGEWGGALPGGDYLRRQVRASPLPGLGDVAALDVVAALPEMMVFSSDYPHSEGNIDPIRLYGDRLDTMGALRANFLGENMAECFDRMGDPVAA